MKLLSRKNGSIPLTATRTNQNQNVVAITTIKVTIATVAMVMTTIIVVTMVTVVAMIGMTIPGTEPREGNHHPGGGRLGNDSYRPRVAIRCLEIAMGLLEDVVGHLGNGVGHLGNGVGRQGDEAEVDHVTAMAEDVDFTMC